MKYAFFFFFGCAVGFNNQHGAHRPWLADMIPIHSCERHVKWHSLPSLPVARHWIVWHHNANKIQNNRAGNCTRTKSFRFRSHHMQANVAAGSKLDDSSHSCSNVEEGVAFGSQGRGLCLYPGLLLPGLLPSLCQTNSIHLYRSQFPLGPFVPSECYLLQPQPPPLRCQFQGPTHTVLLYISRVP